MSQSCWRAILSVPLDNIEGYLYTELRKGHLDGWKAQEKATYLAAKIQSGIEKTTRILHHANISESTQQNAFLETMAMCGLKQLEIPPPHTHIPIEKMVKEVLLADKTFQAFLVTDPSTSQSMLAEIIETISDQVFHAIFRIDPQAIQKNGGRTVNHATRSLRTTKRLFMLFFYKIRRRFLKRHVQGLLTYSMFAYRVTSCLVQ